MRCSMLVPTAFCGLASTGLSRNLLALSPLPAPCPAGAAATVNPAFRRIVNLWAKASAATSLTLMVLLLVQALHCALALPAPAMDAKCLAYLLLGSSALACLVPDRVCALLAQLVLPADVYGALAADGMQTGEPLS